METLEERIRRVTQEEINVVSYNPAWPSIFEAERIHLIKCLPQELIRRIEHFGSTAIPGMSAKPIVDILVEVTSLEKTKSEIVPILDAQGYEYFWRPTRGDDTPPFYAWFIKRDTKAIRTHHIHMVEKEFEHWERLLFRDYLIEHEQTAREYEALKLRLVDEFPRDRIAYTEEKTEFIVKVTEKAKEYYRPAVVKMPGNDR
ncbi:MAG: GrpB family protein [Acidobacteria bacterium]|nr:GrpB family protein [Acidobacteriota bacterium]